MPRKKLDNRHIINPVGGELKANVARKRSKQPQPQLIKWYVAYDYETDITDVTLIDSRLVTDLDDNLHNIDMYEDIGLQAMDQMEEAGIDPDNSTVLHCHLYDQLQAVYIYLRHSVMHVSSEAPS